MSAPATAVLFDLYGTLVQPFRRREHAVAMAECARILGIDADACHERWVASFPGRVRGEFDTVADNFAWIGRELAVEPSAEVCVAAQTAYLTFTREGLQPVANALRLLDELRGSGVRIGLVTNCAPDVPLVWPTTPFAPYFAAPAFSCKLGVVKPDPAIYRYALSALGAGPEEALFVGDGSDEELSGAAACGIRPVLVAAELSNTYDAVRADVQGWRGARVQNLIEVGRLR